MSADTFERLSREVVIIDGKHYRLMSDAEASDFICGVPNIDIRKYANSKQPDAFVKPTTELFSTHESVLRPEVAESLERSMREHSDIWAGLARQ